MPIEHEGKLLCDWCEAQIGLVQDSGDHHYNVRPRIHEANIQEDDDIDDVEGVTEGEIMGYKLKLDCPDCGHPNVVAYGEVVQN